MTLPVFSLIITIITIILWSVIGTINFINNEKHILKFHYSLMWLAFMMTLFSVLITKIKDVL